MSVNPNLKNPLALFALCFLVTESIVMAILMYVANHVAFCTWAVNMFAIFAVAFPTVVFSVFIAILCNKPEVLYSLYEQAIAYRMMAMTNNDSKEHNLAKASNYGISSSAEEFGMSNKANTSKTTIITEESILEQYIAQFAPFMRKNMKAITQNGARYFDGYANWNGCNYVVEVKRLEKWTEAGKRGAKLFALNARSCFSSLDMTLVLYLEEQASQYDIAKDVHNIDPEINIVFASRKRENPSVVHFSSIY